ncbi:MAG TPA: circularly permuted type 2 ATP-grasp protein, partial [Sphingomonas sp.]
IAQPTLALSTVPTLVESGVAPRHVDFRPFCLSGADGVKIVPGGLTRVALKEVSLVVNSSQGGGTKDSLILSDSPRRRQAAPSGMRPPRSQIQSQGQSQSQGEG